MKLPYVRTAVAGVCAFLALQATTTPAHAYTLEVKGRHEWNGHFYGYNETTTRIFYIAGIDADICSDITLPESVHFPQNDDYSDLSGITVAMTGCGYQESGFSWTDDNDSHLTITVPDCYTHMTSDFLMSGRIREITLEASTPATIGGDDWGRSLKIIVNDNAVAAYRAKCDNNEDGWQSSFTIFAKSHRTKKTDVNSNAGGLYDAVKAAAGDDLRDVYNLKITGTIQPSDMNVFSQLPYLISIDLSNVTINMSDGNAPYIWGCKDLYWLETVSLPSEVKGIYDNAFKECHNLSNINLDNITTIGEFAFIGCESLTEVSLPNIESIGSNSFSYCSNLHTATVGDGLKTIKGQAFMCSGLVAFDIPHGCEVSSEFFFDSSVRELTVRDNSGISDNSLVHMNSLESFKCFDPYPYQGNLDMNRENNNQITIYVPAFALDFYNNDNKGFISHKALDEAVDYIEAVRPMEVASVNGIANPVSVKLRDSATYSDYYNSDSRYGSFTNKSTEPIHISKLTQNASYRPAYNYGIEIQIDPTSTFISNCEVTADNMEVNLRLLNGSQQHQAWNYISFPFDVNMKDIKTPEDALWTVMRYDGDGLKVLSMRGEACRCIPLDGIQPGIYIVAVETPDGWSYTKLRL